jgi:UDP:flavonoid glycosyltransferase YjiC (YdhE family)
VSPIRVLLVAPPFSGHLNPLIAIAKRLRERGFAPHFVTGPARVPLLHSLGFPADPILVDDPSALERIADTPRPVGGNPIRLGRQLAQNLALLPRIRRELEQIVDRVEPAAVLADFTAPVAGVVAEAAGIPWLTTMPTPFALETRRGTPAYCGGWGPPRHAGHHLRDALGRGATRFVKRSFGWIFARSLKGIGTTIYRTDGSEAAYSPTAILGLGMLELELERDWPAAFQMIGPITEAPEPTPELPEFLEGDRPRVLVTLGTHLQWAKRDLPERLGRLTAAFPGHQFVVTLGRPTSGPIEARPAGRNVLVCDYLPYEPFLPRFDAVVHHGGAGIVYATLRAGKPALVWPRDYDQFDFAARLEAKGAGLRVQRIDTPPAAEALGRVLDGLDRAAIAELAAAMARYEPYGAVERALLLVFTRRSFTSG